MDCPLVQRPEPAQLLKSLRAGRYHFKTGPWPSNYFRRWTMDAGLSAARQARAQHRHELRTLTYVTLDQANGGIVRNLSHGGMGAQVVAAVRPRQQLHVRFELRYPRLRIEARGEVVWATFSGQCGIRFLDLSPRVCRQIDEWIFGNLLEGISLHSESEESIFAPSPRRGEVRSPDIGVAVEEDDGLMLSAARLKVIELPAHRDLPAPVRTHDHLRASDTSEPGSADQLDWLSQPLSGRSLAWAVHTLVVMAGILLFVLVFLSVNREAPRWPLAMAGGAACVVAALYWFFFQIFGGTSLGARLARLTADANDEEEEVIGARFR